MAPKNFFVILLTLFVGLKTSYGDPPLPPCKEFYENCSTESAQCTITCEDPSSCVSTGDPAKCPQDVTTTPMVKGSCKPYCSADIGCFYYKYQEVAGIQYCYLMGENECNDWGENCSPDYCESGKRDDAECEEGGNGGPVPEFDCPGETQHTPGTIPDFKLHWSCFSVSKEGNVDLREKTVPGDTICKAYPECNGELVVYSCKSDEAPTPKGVWTYEGDQSDDPGFVEDNGSGRMKLSDPICNANDLTLDNYVDQRDNKGMEILCVVEGSLTEDNTAGTIKAQNSCLLICDGYPILNFYTNEQSWKYTLMEGSEETLDEENADAVIYCHQS